MRALGLHIESIKNERAPNIGVDALNPAVQVTSKTVMPLESDALSNIDYRKYYFLERYLFDEVAKTFEKNKKLSAFDFFCIVIWKTNRAKSKVAKRLLEHGPYNNLNQAVLALTSEVAKAQGDEARMKVLFSVWGFQLPMASAILTVLYPKTFTIYDVRVCEALDKFKLKNCTNFEALWSEYKRYIKAVRKRVTKNYELRDKDRWLWGKSFSEQLQKDVTENFKKIREENETEAYRER